MVFRELIRALLYNLFIIAIIFIALSFCSGCGHGRTYRMYVHDAQRGLFVRDENNKDVKRYEEGHGFICMDDVSLINFSDQVAYRKSGLCEKNKECDVAAPYKFYFFDAKNNVFIRDEDKNDKLSLMEAGGLNCFEKTELLKMAQDVSTR